MSVSVQINAAANDGFQIIRKWFFSRAGDWTDEEVLIYEVRNGIKDKAIEPMEAYRKCHDRETFIQACKKAGIPFDPRKDGEEKAEA